MQILPITCRKGVRPQDNLEAQRQPGGQENITFLKTRGLSNVSLTKIPVLFNINVGGNKPISSDKIKLYNMPQ